MRTRFLTQLSTTLNPFSPSSKTPRLFLAQLPPTIRSSVKVTVTQLPRDSTKPSTLNLTFKDGKEMKFVFEERQKDDTKGGEQLKLQDVINEVDRHSRGLERKEDLSN